MGVNAYIFFVPHHYIFLILPLFSVFTQCLEELFLVLSQLIYRLQNGDSKSYPTRRECSGHVRHGALVHSVDTSDMAELEAQENGWGTGSHAANVGSLSVSSTAN